MKSREEIQKDILRGLKMDMERQGKNWDVHAVAVIIILRKFLRVGTDHHNAFALWKILPKDLHVRIRKMMLREAAEQPDHSRVSMRIQFVCSLFDGLFHR